MGDFLTLAQRSLPVKVVVFDNSGPKRSASVGSGSRSRAKARQSEFCRHGPVRRGRARRQFRPRLLVDAVVNRTELAMPPSITLEMAKGFTLYMVKAIMNGRTDEIIDLAKSNLWR